MLNVDQEYGPYSNIYIPVGAGIPASVFGYGPSFGQTALGQAVSTGRAIAGVAGTAMSQLSNMKNGVPQSIVFFDLMAPLR